MGRRNNGLLFTADLSLRTKRVKFYKRQEKNNTSLTRYCRPLSIPLLTVPRERHGVSFEIDDPSCTESCKPKMVVAVEWLGLGCLEYCRYIHFLIWIIMMHSSLILRYRVVLKKNLPYSCEWTNIWSHSRPHNFNSCFCDGRCTWV